MIQRLAAGVTSYLLYRLRNKVWVSLDRRQLRNMQFSFSQFGEDRLIDHYLSGTRTGFYVDIGCHDPDHVSNTLLLHKRGWKGINVDARKGAVDLFNGKRTQDHNICAIVSNNDGQLLKFRSIEGGLTSKVVTDGETSVQGDDVSAKSSTLNSILQNCVAPTVIDYLNIDVEGHDLDVLKGLNFDRWSIRLMTIEALNENVASEIHQFLSARGFMLIGATHWTLFFADKSMCASTLPLSIGKHRERIKHPKDSDLA